MDLKEFKLELIRRHGETQRIMLEGSGKKNGQGYTFMVMDGSQVPDEEELDELVRRWNLHEELLKALKDLVDSIESQLGCTDTGSQTEDDWSDLPAARSVIAKAKKI